MVEKSLVSRQEAKIRELETKLEYERTQTKRLEVSHVAAHTAWHSYCIQSVYFILYFSCKFQFSFSLS